MPAQRGGTCVRVVAVQAAAQPARMVAALPVESDLRRSTRVLDQGAVPPDRWRSAAWWVPLLDYRLPSRGASSLERAARPAALRVALMAIAAFTR